MSSLKKMQIGLGSLIVAIVFYFMLAAPALLTDMQPDITKTHHIAAAHP